MQMSDEALSDDQTSNYRSKKQMDQRLQKNLKFINGMYQSQKIERDYSPEELNTSGAF